MEQYSPTSSVCHYHKQGAPILPLALSTDNQFAFQHVFISWIEQEDQAYSYSSDTWIHFSKHLLITGNVTETQLR